MLPNNAISRYDKRADAENLIKESQHEGIAAIPSKNFQNNYAYFQIVMLAYNLWRWMKLIAGHRYETSNQSEIALKPKVNIIDNTVRIARLKMLFIAAKVVTHSNTTKVRYSVHDSRSSEIIDFLGYLDRKKVEDITWEDNLLLYRYRRTG